MRKYRNILVIVESQMEQQIALKRALEIAKFSPETQITSFLAIYDFSYDLTSILSLEEQINMKNGIVKNNELWLENELENYKQNYPLLKSKVVWQRNIAEAILKELATGSYDLILKSSEKHGFLDSMIFTPLDWQLLRSSPIPVLLAKEHPWVEKGNILVAVNFSSDQDKYQRLMNIRLLRNAQELATLTNGNIHLINAAPPVIPAAVVEIPGFSPDIYSEALLKHNQEKLTIFANKHRIPACNCHVKEGQPDDVIPDLAAELNACAVLIGNEGRIGLSGAIIGNTCEQIVDDLNCDLLVIRNNEAN